MITVLNWDLLTPAAWAMANANNVDVGVGRSMLINNIRHGREVDPNEGSGPPLYARLG